MYPAQLPLFRLFSIVSVIFILSPPQHFQSQDNGGLGIGNYCSFTWACYASAFSCWKTRGSIPVAGISGITTGTTLTTATRREQRQISSLLPSTSFRGLPFVRSPAGILGTKHAAGASLQQHHSDTLQERQVQEKSLETTNGNDIRDARIEMNADDKRNLENENNLDVEASNAAISECSTPNINVLHTFHYPPENITLHGLGVSLPQFNAWIRYKLQCRYNDNGRNASEGIYENFTDFGIDLNLKQPEGDATESWVNYTSSKQIHVRSNPGEDRSSQGNDNSILDTNDDEYQELRRCLRKEWLARRLISDRTELLDLYPNDSDEDSNMNGNGDDDNMIDGNMKRKVKRGGFEDLLSVYTKRLVNILHDEITESTTSETTQRPIFNLKTWLQKEYGYEETINMTVSRSDTHNFDDWVNLKHKDMKSGTFQDLQVDEQLQTMQHFLDWFKHRFPYYYDRCDSCSASYRDDKIAMESKTDQNANIDSESTANGIGESGKAIELGAELKSSFVGYVHPEENELAGKASRTELYKCHVCKSYTRFPRYNAVQQIVENRGRGRCGEYSILLYRILRALGHETRWVVDTADHVWAECWIHGLGRWVHMDPCEAVIDHPALLYEEWGKKQTYIVAFWMPLFMNRSDSHDSKVEDTMERLDDNCRSKGGNLFLLIEDATSNYTSDTLEEIESRREEDAISIIEIAETKLRKELLAAIAQKL